jgi:hypothetical protein
MQATNTEVAAACPHDDSRQVTAPAHRRSQPSLHQNLLEFYRRQARAPEALGTRRYERYQIADKRHRDDTEWT